MNNRIGTEMVRPYACELVRDDEEGWVKFQMYGQYYEATQGTRFRTNWPIGIPAKSRMHQMVDAGLLMLSRHYRETGEIPQRVGIASPEEGRLNITFRTN